MKNSKSAESIYLSILNFKKHGWSFLWHVYCYHVYFFLQESQICTSLHSLKGWSTWIGILWKWTSMLIELSGGDGECRLAWFYPIKNFLAKDICHFSRLYYLYSPRHKISFLFRNVCMFQNVILDKMLEIGFWKLKPIFPRMQFSLAARFLSLVLVICLSWCLNLKLA